MILRIATYVYCTPFSVLNINTLILLPFLVVTLTPAFIVTVVASVWTLRIFKKKIVFRPDSKSVNRKMILLPFLMGILQLLNTSVPYVTTTISNTVLSNLDVGDFYGCLANIFAILEYFIFDVVHGLSFPLALLYLYANVRKTWKTLACKLLYCLCTKH